jgi:hypothetical protein
MRTPRAKKSPGVDPLKHLWEKFFRERLIEPLGWSFSGTSMSNVAQKPIKEKNIKTNEPSNFIAKV